jgi:putative aldouronate transport system permease protein
MVANLRSGAFKRLSRRDKNFLVFNYCALTAVLLIVLYPLIYIVSSSLSSVSAVLSGEVWLWPVDFSLEGYKAVLGYSKVWIGYRNTLFYTAVGTAINVVLTIAIAYPLSRKDFGGRNTIMFILAFTMLFNGGMIPTYLLVQKLGIMNSRWAMLLPNAIAVWNVIITRTYYQSYIPDELLEAAKMDGCSDFRFMRHVVLPLSGAITAVNVLFYAVGHWNQYFQAFLYLNDQDLFPLQIFLRQILVINDIDADMMQNLDVAQVNEGRLGLKELIKYAVIVVASVPMLMVYPFAQRHFVKGVMIGSLKG